MDTLTLTTFLGWTVVIHFVLLGFTAFMLIAGREFIVSIHSEMLHLSQEELLPLYVRFLANYKIAVIVFSLVPWLALKFMGY